jgi:hypothetical protein
MMFPIFAAYFFRTKLREAFQLGLKSAKQTSKSMTFSIGVIDEDFVLLKSAIGDGHGDNDATTNGKRRKISTTLTTGVMSTMAIYEEYEVKNLVDIGDLFELLGTNFFFYPKTIIMHTHGYNLGDDVICNTVVTATFSYCRLTRTLHVKCSVNQKSKLECQGIITAATTPRLLHRHPRLQPWLVHPLFLENTYHGRRSPARGISMTGKF